MPIGKSSYKVLVLVTAVNAALVAVAWLGVTVARPGGAQEPVPGVLQASEFQLVNGSGTVVAQLYTGEDGDGNIRLRDASGTVRVKLSAVADGSGLLLMDGGDPEPGVTAESDEDGTTLTLHEEGTRDRVLRPRG